MTKFSAPQHMARNHPAVLALAVNLLGTASAHAATEQESTFWSTILLWDFNTRVVVGSTILLGLSAGAVGCFSLLRKRALLGDALSHATLPGIGVAFLVATAWGFQEKSLPLLLTGALLSGLLGILLILGIQHGTRIKQDAAMGIILSVFFGIGVCLLVAIQQMSRGHAAGLEGFIYGKTASMVVRDAWLIGLVGLCCVLTIVALFRPLKLLCFDEEFAATRGQSTKVLDFVLMSLVVAVTIVGLQAVGGILVIALLVTPAAAARFWSHNLVHVVLLSSLFGAASAWLGTTASAVFPNLPSGAMIVLAASMLFALSLLLGSDQGVFVLALRNWLVQDRIERQHFLRAVFERLEVQGAVTEETARARTVPISELVPVRSWGNRAVTRQIRRCERAGLVRNLGLGGVGLTSRGLLEASRLTQEHRLLEHYLLTHTDMPPTRVDHGADALEHFLPPELMARLEAEWRGDTSPTLPSSPHPLP